jgi:hypothetical protein
MPSPLAGEAHPKRNLLFLRASLWPHWPFLPVIRGGPDGTKSMASCSTP